MLRRYWVLLFFFMLISPALGQDSVTFDGKIDLHSLVKTNVALQGEVELSYVEKGTERTKSVVVPFVVPKGGGSANYTIDADWSDVARDFRGTAMGIVVKIRCLEGCEENNITNIDAFYTNNGETSLVNLAEAELFGANSRDNYYRVDLTVLPMFAKVTGTLKLPDNLVAKRDTQAKLIGFYSNFRVKYITLSRSFVTPVTIKAGERSVRFSMNVPTEDVISKFENYSFGYSCDSQECEDLGVAGRVWFDSDQDKYTSNISQSRLIELDAGFSNKSNILSLPNPVTMQKSVGKSVVLTRPSKDSTQRIEGTIYVELRQVEQYCYSTPAFEGRYRVNFQVSQDICYDFFRGFDTKIIDSKDFVIPANELSAEVDVRTGVIQQQVQPLEDTHQPLSDNLRSPLEHVSFRFECRVGCESRRLLKRGYFAGQDKRFSSRRLIEAGRFYQASKILNSEIEIKLVKPPVIEPVVDLIMTN